MVHSMDSTTLRQLSIHTKMTSMIIPGTNASLIAIRSEGSSRSQIPPVISTEKIPSPEMKSRLPSWSQSRMPYRRGNANATISHRVVPSCASPENLVKTIIGMMILMMRLSRCLYCLVIVWTIVALLGLTNIKRRWVSSNFL